jgi:hypothetical protein
MYKLLSVLDDPSLSPALFSGHMHENLMYLPVKPICQMNNTEFPHVISHGTEELTI